MYEQNFKEINKNSETCGYVEKKKRNCTLRGDRMNIGNRNPPVSRQFRQQIAYSFTNIQASLGYADNKLIR